MLNYSFKKIKTEILNRKNLQWITIYWLAFFFVIPLIILLILHFFYIETDINFLSLKFNLSNLSNVFAPENLFYLGNSFKLAISTAFTTTIIGFSLAFFVHFLRTSLKNYLIVLICLSYIINPVIQFYSINTIFSTNGLVNYFLISSGIISTPVLISKFAIATIILSYKSLPIVFFVTTVVIKNINPTQLEAAMDLGLSRTRLFFSFICRGSLPGIIASFLFVFILSFGNFSSILAFSFNNIFFSSKIINNITSNSNILFISADLFVTSIITILFLVAYKIYSDKHTDFDAEFLGENISKYKCSHVGKSVFSFLLNFPIIIFLHINLLYIFIFSFNKTSSIVNFENFSFYWYELIFENNNIIIAFKNSFIIATFSALGSTLLGAMLSLSFSKYKELLSLEFTRIIRLTLIVSEVFFASGIVFAIKLLGLNTNIYLSNIIALSVVGVLLSTLIIHSKIKEIDLNMESASLDLGADYIQTFKKIFSPVVLNTICSCFLIILVFSLNEFALSYATCASSLPVLSTALLSQTVQPTPLLNAVSSIVIFISIVFISVANVFSFYKERTRNIKFSLIILIFIITIILIIF